MKFRLRNKELALLVSILLLVTVTVGGTVAYIFTQTDEITNTFKPAEVTCMVEEDFDNTKKENVKVTNTGDVDAFIRASFIVTWKDSAGNIAAEPVSADAYTMSLNEGDWFKGAGDYYYYSKPVAVGTSTANLINSCTLASGVTPPEGYYLSVEIIADAVQAEPAEAVRDAWGVTVSNGGISH